MRINSYLQWILSRKLNFKIKIPNGFYKTISAEIVSQAEALLPPEFLEVIRQFNARFGVS
jgi:hypothetical protein